MCQSHSARSWSTNTAAGEVSAVHVRATGFRFAVRPERSRHETGRTHNPAMIGARDEPAAQRNDDVEQVDEQAGGRC
jgi:hypothetical protein